MEPIYRRVENARGKLASTLDELATILNEGYETRSQLRDFSNAIRHEHEELQRLLQLHMLLVEEERGDSPEDNPEA